MATATGTVDLEKRPAEDPAEDPAEQQPLLSQPCSSGQSDSRFCRLRRGRPRRGCSCCAMRVLAKVLLLAVLVVGLGRFFGVGFGAGCGAGFDRNRLQQQSFAPSQREIVVDRGARSIWGRYPLYDLLSLKTTSGSIAVTIDPQPADPANPDEPARLSIQSESGSVVVAFKFAAPSPDEDDVAALPPLQLDDYGKHHVLTRLLRAVRPDCWSTQQQQQQQRALPARPYEVDVRTQTGSISGRFVFSSSARLSTDTGSISAALIPVVIPEHGPLAESYDSNPGNSSSTPVSIETVTGTGSQQINMHAPVFPAASDASSTSTRAGKPAARASHVVGETGSLHIRYPPQWAGTVHAHSEQQQGAICLDGKGLVVSKDGQGSADGHKDPVEDDGAYAWWGGRGDMAVSLEVDGSGSIMFAVG